MLNTTDNHKKFKKVVVNVGVGRLSSMPNFEEKILPELIKAVGLITGQKPAPCEAKKSIAGFKLRAGTIVGLKATLRGKRMKDFLERLVNIVLPRVRDFRGIDPKSMDNIGNLTIGFKDYSVFPEVILDISRVNFGLEVTIVPKIQTKEKAVELYKTLGIPFKKNG